MKVNALDDQWIKKHGIDKSKLIDEGIYDLCLTCQNTKCGLRGIKSVNLVVTECDNWIYDLEEQDGSQTC